MNLIAFGLSFFIGGFIGNAFAAVLCFGSISLCYLPLKKTDVRTELNKINEIANTLGVTTRELKRAYKKMLPIPIFYFISGIIIILGGIVWCILSILIGVGLYFEFLMHVIMGILMIAHGVFNIQIYNKSKGFPAILKILTIISLGLVLVAIPAFLPFFF